MWDPNTSYFEASVKFKVYAISFLNMPSIRMHIFNGKKNICFAISAWKCSMMSYGVNKCMG